MFPLTEVFAREVEPRVDQMQSGDTGGDALLAAYRSSRRWRRREQATILHRFADANGDLDRYAFSRAYAEILSMRNKDRRDRREDRSVDTVLPDDDEISDDRRQSTTRGSDRFPML